MSDAARVRLIDHDSTLPAWDQRNRCRCRVGAVNEPRCQRRATQEDGLCDLCRVDCTFEVNR